MVTVLPLLTTLTTPTTSATTTAQNSTTNNTTVTHYYYYEVSLPSYEASFTAILLGLLALALSQLRHGNDEGRWTEAVN